VVDTGRDRRVATLDDEHLQSGWLEAPITMVRRGFASAELRGEQRAGLPNAFARLEQIPVP
jgi:hypothetical protein